MINFRFHLVSLIAVFLALGLGILVGSTVVDQVIVDRLDREIESVRADSKQANAETGQLKEQVAAYDRFVQASADYAVDGRLDTVPVALVAERGVADGPVKETLALAQKAGGVVPGIFWLTERWNLGTPADLAALQKELGLTSGNNATARSDALEVLAKRLARPAPATSPDATPADPLDAFRKAGFLEFTDGDRAALASFPARASSALLITGTKSALKGSGTIESLAAAFVGQKTPTVVGELYDDNGKVPPVPERGAALAPVRGNGELRSAVSTVDDLELTQGRVAAVIALAQAGQSVYGSYGYGQGATALPPASS